METDNHPTPATNRLTRNWPPSRPIPSSRHRLSRAESEKLFFQITLFTQKYEKMAVSYDFKCRGDYQPKNSVTK
jgi:hypothetical protein